MTYIQHYDSPLGGILLAAHLPDKITFRFQSVFLLDREMLRKGRPREPPFLVTAIHTHIN